MIARGARRLVERFAVAVLLGTALLHAPGAGGAHAQSAPDSLVQAPPDRTGLAPIPNFEGYVTDQAHVLDDDTRAKLESFLDQLEKKTGAEFAVLTIPATAPETPDQYKVRVFQTWKIGKKGQDNGLLMLFALGERELRFETGYGLEGTLPDGYQSRVFRTEMVPRFQAGDYAGGITAGVLAMAQRIAAEKGVTLEWNGAELRYGGGGSRNLPIGAWILIAIAVFMLIGWFNGGGPGSPRRRRRYGGWNTWDGGWGGGCTGGCTSGAQTSDLGVLDRFVDVPPNRAVMVWPWPSLTLAGVVTENACAPFPFPAALRSPRYTSARTLIST